MIHKCERCETLPEWTDAGGTAYFWPPMGHSRAKIERVIADVAPRAPVTAIQGGVAVALDSEGFADLLPALERTLTSFEQRDTRYLLKSDGAPIGLADFAALESLATAIARFRSRWLLEVIGAARLETYFHPIVHGNAQDRIYAHECLLRWRDEAERIQGPGALFDAARAADLLFQLDRSARETAVLTAAAAGMTENLFINFAPSAIYDPKNCLATTLAAIQSTGLAREKIVFEVIETEHVQDVEHLKSILAFYRDNGFRVALDDLGSGYASLNLLGALRPDIAKIDMDLVRDVDSDPFKAGIVRRIIDLAHEFGIEVVAEGVETAAEAAWLGEHRADFLQGFHFARPAPQPVSVIAA